MSVLYPIAPDVAGALSAPLGRAARERDAGALAGADVEFVREFAGPEFETREAVLAAYGQFLDAEGRPSIAPEDRYCEVVETAAQAGKSGRDRGGQAEPTFEAGSRWPKPKRMLTTVWRLSVSYWRIVDAARRSTLPQARQARRSEDAEGLDAASLRAMAEQPLRPVRAQQPLDIGLFEVRPPDAPHIIMPDE
jgi:hypothetical protein